MSTSAPNLTDHAVADPISRRIKAIRTQQGISQTDLAASLQLERSNYHRMENRGQKLTLELLTRIAQALGVPLLQFLSDEPARADQIALERLQQRTIELADRLADKQALVQAYQTDQRALVEQVEQSLIRLWAAHRKSVSSSSVQALLNHPFVGPALAQFTGQDESDLILTKRFSGPELVALALACQLRERSFFELVLKLLELGILNPDSLYGRAFRHVGHTGQVYPAVFESVAQPD